MADPLERSASRMPQYAALQSQNILQGGAALASGIANAGESLGAIPERMQQYQRGALQIAREEMELRRFDERLEGEAKLLMLRQQQAQTQLMERQMLLQSAEIDQRLERFGKLAGVADLAVPLPGGEYAGVTSVSREGGVKIGPLGPNDARVQQYQQRKQQAAQAAEAKRLESIAKSVSTMASAGGKGSGGVSSDDLVKMLSGEFTGGLPEDSPLRELAQGELTRRLRKGSAQQSGAEVLKEYKQSPNQEALLRTVVQKYGPQIEGQIAEEYEARRAEAEQMGLTPEQALALIIRGLLETGFRGGRR